MCRYCLENLRQNAAKLQGPRAAPLVGRRPTVAGLERHAARFGPAQVPETAEEFGLKVSVEREKATKRGGPTLKQRVATLLAAGHSVETIAEVEDLSPARARKLIEELS